MVNYLTRNKRERKQVHQKRPRKVKEPDKNPAPPYSGHVGKQNPIPLHYITFLVLVQPSFFQIFSITCFTKIPIKSIYLSESAGLANTANPASKPLPSTSQHNSQTGGFPHLFTTKRCLYHTIFYTPKNTSFKNLKTR